MCDWTKNLTEFDLDFIKDMEKAMDECDADEKTVYADGNGMSKAFQLRMNKQHKTDDTCGKVLY